MSRWKEEYQRKLVTPEEAVKVINSGQHIVLPLGGGEPPDLLEAMAKRKDELEGVVLHQLLALRKLAYLQPGMESHFRHNSWFTSGASRAMVQAGLADVTPNYFHDVPRLITDYVDVDILMASVSPMDEHGYFSFGLSVDYTTTAAQKAKVIILEVNPHMPRTMGNCFVHIKDATMVVESSSPIPELAAAPITERDMVIGQYIADLVENGSTIQLGIGGIPNAVAQCLLNKEDLGIHTEMIVDGMVDLVEKGVVTGKKKSMHKGKLVGTFALGSNKLYKFLDNNPLIEMHPVSYTNEPYVIGQQYKMVSVNAAVEVDLLGQCCSESIGYVQFSGTGGQADYARGAVRSQGGKGFITVPATAKAGKISRIVPRLSEGAVVTTSKNDVDHVVTEFGVAKLRGRTFKERAEALIAIAHPDFRPWLREEAKKMNVL